MWNMYSVGENNSVSLELFCFLGGKSFKWETVKQHNIYLSCGKILLLIILASEMGKLFSRFHCISIWKWEVYSDFFNIHIILKFHGMRSTAVYKSYNYNSICDQKSLCSQKRVNFFYQNHTWKSDIVNLWHETMLPYFSAEAVTGLL